MCYQAKLTTSCISCSKPSVHQIHTTCRIQTGAWNNGSNAFDFMQLPMNHRTVDMRLALNVARQFFDRWCMYAHDIGPQLHMSRWTGNGGLHE